LFWLQNERKLLERLSQYGTGDLEDKEEEREREKKDDNGHKKE
jgi:hypothetical protein